MKFLNRSLRLRLLILILLPLILVSLAAISWRYNEARNTAEEIFDRNLLLMSFAVARDVALSEGDSLSQATNTLFKELSGGAIFYHVYGPDGSFVTGYSSPPIAPKTVKNASQVFDAVHRGQPVRVARLTEQSEISGISGLSVITVWQKLDQRDEFARKAALRAGAIVLLLLLTVLLLVLFGIRLGLRPLLELEEAIQKRSGDDLSPIARQVPQEIQGIVTRLNTLFGQVTAAQESKDRFISNAAHQLRNPIAAIHSMAQATRNAKKINQAHERADLLVSETRRAGRLTDQLLSLERLKGQKPQIERLVFNHLIERIATRFAPDILSQGLEFSVDIPKESIVVLGNDTLLNEAISNLLDNAIKHCGDKATYISLRLSASNSDVELIVENDGNPLRSQDGVDLFNRFTQGSESDGSGLGLAIVKEIVAIHSGEVFSVDSDHAIVLMRLPYVDI